MFRLLNEWLTQSEGQGVHLQQSDLSTPHRLLIGGGAINQISIKEKNPKFWSSEDGSGFFPPDVKIQILIFHA